MKKAIIIYDTVYGNTKKVAMSLSRGLEAGGTYVDCMPIMDCDLNALYKYDIIGIGGPTHYHGITITMKSFLSKLKNMNLEKKVYFVFETKGDFPLSGSAAKRIDRTLRKMNMKKIHPLISEIVLNKEGTLFDSTFKTTEQIGIFISNSLIHNQIDEDLNGSELKISKIYLKRLKWILLVGGSLFFCIRAIFMTSTGGDCFGRINAPFSWFLLSSEIAFSGFTVIIGMIGLALFLKENQARILAERLKIPQIIIFTGITSYSVHFIRVAIWIVLCVL